MYKRECNPYTLPCHSLRSSENFLQHEILLPKLIRFELPFLSTALDGAEKQPTAHLDEHNDIQIAVIGGALAQQQRLGATSAGNARTSELAAERPHRGSTDSGVRSDAARRDRNASAYDNQQAKYAKQQPTASNDSNDSNRSESIQSVESALYTSHHRTSQSASSGANRPSAGHEPTAARARETGHQKDYSLKPRSESSAVATNPILELASAFTESNRQRKQSLSGGHPYHRRSVGGGGRLSVADVAASAGGGGGIFRRRRAVEISDHKAVVLLHSKLKGMKLEDIAWVEVFCFSAFVLLFIALHLI